MFARVESLASESLQPRRFLGDILLDLCDVLRRGRDYLVLTRGNVSLGGWLVEETRRLE